VRDHAQPGALPLRPLTTGELLDAAVVLLRTRAARLLGLGALLALAEQAVLFPLRRLADVDSSFFPAEDRLFAFGFVIVAGLGLEALCIAVLGGVAATQAPRALLGTAAPAPNRSRLGSVVVVGTVVAVVCAATGWAFLLLPVPLQIVGLMFAFMLTGLAWPLAYGLTGLAAPAVVVDQLGPARALGRSIQLAARTGMRAVWIRVLGYFAWLGIRIGLGFAMIALITIVYASPSATADNVIMGVTWLTVNALAYPMLGCLDVAIHLDVRMRTEGLDIALRRSVRRGVATNAALAVPR
jgi:hypothetical protein